MIVHSQRKGQLLSKPLAWILWLTLQLSCKAKEELGGSEGPHPHETDHEH